MEIKDVIVLIALLIIIFTVAAVVTFIETPPKYEIVIDGAAPEWYLRS